MAAAYAQQLEQPVIHELSFDERFAILVEREVTMRENRKQTRLLGLAKLRQPAACVEDIDYRHPRGLERSRMASLITCDFVRARQNLHITGPTGTGKSVAGVRVRTTSVPTRALGSLRADAALAGKICGWRAATVVSGKNCNRIAKTELLILDDFGLKPLLQSEKHDLLEVIEDRHGLRSTLLTSQLPIKTWHEYLGDPTVADALLDRLLNNAHRLELRGESLRKNGSDLDLKTQVAEKITKIRVWRAGKRSVQLRTKSAFSIKQKERSSSPNTH